MTIPKRQLPARRRLRKHGGKEQRLETNKKEHSGSPLCRTGGKGREPVLPKALKKVAFSGSICYSLYTTDISETVSSVSEMKDLICVRTVSGAVWTACLNILFTLFFPVS